MSIAIRHSFFNTFAEKIRLITHGCYCKENLLSQETEFEMKQLIIILAVLITAVLASCQPAANPEELVRAWGEAMNAGDLDTVLSYMADDATIQLVPPPMEGHDGVFSGKKALREWYERLIALHSVGTIHELQVSGDQVTATLNYTDDELKSIGIDSIDNHWIIKFRNGKIQGYTVTMTDESLAKLMAAMSRLPLVGTWKWEKGYTKVLLQFNPNGTYSMHAAPWPSEKNQTALEALAKNPGDSGTYQVADNKLTLTSGDSTVVCNPGDILDQELTFLAEGRIQFSWPHDECEVRIGPADPIFVIVDSD